MQDRLVELLKRFHLRADVFQAGPLCHGSRFYGDGELGYIHLLKEGSIRIESPHHPTIKITEPSVIFYLNSTQHRLIPTSSVTETVCASIEFGAGLSNPLARALPDALVVRLKDMPDVELALQLLFREADQSHCGRQAILDRMMEVVFIQILRETMDQKRLQVGLLAGLADPRLAKAINGMHEAPAFAWTLENLADKAGMSRARFAAHFHKVVGITPGHYLSEWRLTIVQAQLRRGKSVAWIADTVGYSNASALSRAFRTHTGLSPMEWLHKTTN